MLKSIIFDFDGVIHDTFDIVYPISHEIHGITPDEYRDLFNGNVFQHAKINEEKSQMFFDKQVASFKNLQIEKHIKEELLKIKEKFKMFIVSSNSEIILNEYFENNNIIHIFERVLGVETHKSKEEKFKILMADHDVTRDNAVFVTDTLGDILEANKIGISSIAVDFGFHDRTRLEKGNPKHIISDFKHLLPKLENWL